jgi:hypothetical protein
MNKRRNQDENPVFRNHANPVICALSMEHRKKRAWIVAFMAYPDVIATPAKAIAQMGLPRQNGAAVINQQSVEYTFFT